MTQSTENSSLPTANEARARTAQLIAECPGWCTGAHDPADHPEDVTHRRVIRETEWGPIELIVRPVDAGDLTQALVLPEIEFGTEISFAQAQSLSGALMRATDALRMAHYGRYNRIAEVRA
jgi:hypothetical protein